MCGHLTTDVVIELLCDYWTNKKEKPAYILSRRLHIDKVYTEQ